MSNYSRLSKILLLVSIVLAISSFSVSATNFGTDLALYYNFSQTAGNIIDSSPSGVNANDYEINSRTATGILGNGYDFEATGRDDYILIPYNAALNRYTNDQFTYNIWLKPESFDESFFFPGRCNYATDWNREICWAYTTTTNEIYSYVVFADDTGAGGQTTSLSFAANPMTLNEWQMMTYTYNGTTLNVYRNGVIVTSYSYSGNIFDDTTVGAVTTFSKMHSSEPYAGTANFDGLADEMGFWKRGMQQTEVQSLYNSYLAGCDPVANPNGCSIVVNGSKTWTTGSDFTGQYFNITYSNITLGDQFNLTAYQPSVVSALNSKVTHYYNFTGSGTQLTDIKGTAHGTTNAQWITSTANEMTNRLNLTGGIGSTYSYIPFSAVGDDAHTWMFCYDQQYYTGGYSFGANEWGVDAGILGGPGSAGLGLGSGYSYVSTSLSTTNITEMPDVCYFLMQSGSGLTDNQLCILNKQTGTEYCSSVNQFNPYYGAITNIGVGGAESTAGRNAAENEETWKGEVGAIQVFNTPLNSSERTLATDYTDWYTSTPIYKQGTLRDTTGWMPPSGHAFNQLTINATVPGTSQLKIRYANSVANLDAASWINLSNGINTLSLVGMNQGDPFYYEYLFVANSPSPTINEFTLTESTWDLVYSDTFENGTVGQYLPVTFSSKAYTGAAAGPYWQYINSDSYEGTKSIERASYIEGTLSGLPIKINHTTDSYKVTFYGKQNGDPQNRLGLGMQNSTDSLTNYGYSGNTYVWAYQFQADNVGATGSRFYVDYGVRGNEFTSFSNLQLPEVDDIWLFYEYYINSTCVKADIYYTNGSLYTSSGCLYDPTPNTNGYDLALFTSQQPSTQLRLDDIKVYQLIQTEVPVVQANITEFTGPSTTNFTGYTDTNYSDTLLTLENTEGKIVWSGNLNLSSHRDLDSYVQISLRNIYVDSVTAPPLNAAAQLTFYNTGYTATNQFHVYKDGSLCSTCSGLSINGQNVSVTTTGFSNHTLENDTAPTVPTLTYPVGGEVLTSSPINITWTASTDAENDTVYYNVSYSTDNTTWTLIANNTASPYLWDFSALSDGSPYYIKVTADDTYLSNQSISAGFRINLDAPTTPSLIYPIGGETLTSQVNIIYWNLSTSELPVSYEVSYSTDNSSWSTVVSGINQNISRVVGGYTTIASVSGISNSAVANGWMTFEPNENAWIQGFRADATIGSHCAYAKARLYDQGNLIATSPYCTSPQAGKAECLWSDPIAVYQGHNYSINYLVDGGYTCNVAFGGASPLPNDWNFRFNGVQGVIQMYGWDEPKYGFYNWNISSLPDGYPYYVKINSSDGYLSNNQVSGEFRLLQYPQLNLTTDMVNNTDVINNVTINYTGVSNPPGALYNCTLVADVNQTSTNLNLSQTQQFTYSTSDRYKAQSLQIVCTGEYTSTSTGSYNYEFYNIQNDMWFDDFTRPDNFNIEQNSPTGITWYTYSPVLSDGDWRDWVVAGIKIENNTLKFPNVVQAGVSWEGYVGNFGDLSNGLRDGDNISFTYWHQTNSGSPTIMLGLGQNSQLVPSRSTNIYPGGFSGQYWYLWNTYNPSVYGIYYPNASSRTAQEYGQIYFSLTGTTAYWYNWPAEANGCTGPSMTLPYSAHTAPINFTFKPHIQNRTMDVYANGALIGTGSNCNILANKIDSFYLLQNRNGVASQRYYYLDNFDVNLNPSLLIYTDMVNNTINYNDPNLTINYNATVFNTSNIADCSLYVNDVLNQTQTSVDVTTQQSFGLTFGNTTTADFNFKITCTNGQATDTTKNYLYRVDTITPAIESNYNMYDGQTFQWASDGVPNETINISTRYYDENEYAINETIRCGGIVKYNNFEQNVSWTNETREHIFGASFFGTNTCNVTLQNWDSHTNNNVRPLPWYFSGNNLIADGAITFEGAFKQLTGQGQPATYFYLAPDNTKYKFKVTFNDQALSHVINITAPDLVYLPNSQYKAHFVYFPNFRWIDFQGTNINTAQVTPLGNNKYQINVTHFTSTDEIEFESIGDLNYNVRSYLFNTQEIPTQPIITNPNGGEVLLKSDGTETITWTQSSLAGSPTKVFYNISSSTNGIDWTQVAYVANTTSYNWNIGVVPASSNYQLRVISISSEDPTSYTGYDYSDSTFVVADTPTIPTITYPNGGETLYGQSIGSYNITWTASTGELLFNYNLYYSNNSGSSWNYLTDVSSGTEIYLWDISNMTKYPAGTQYRIKVLANNTYVTVEDTSNTDFEIVQNNPPVISAVAIINTPAYTDTTLQGQCNATDDGISQPLSYTYNWYKNGASLGINSITLPGTNFVKHDLIKFECSVFDGLVTVAQNSTQIEIQNTIPTTPVISIPINGSTLGLSTITVLYSSTDTDGDTLTYAVYLDNSVTPTTLVQNSTGSGYLYSGSDGTYYTRVMAYDGEESSGYSGTIHFTKNTNAPTVTLLMPSNLGMLISGSNIFTYNVTPASNYNVSYCELYMKGVLIQNDTTVTRGVISNFTQSLTPDTDYTWYVKCVDQYGLSTTSSTRYFVVRAEDFRLIPSTGGTGNTFADEIVEGAKEAIPEAVQNNAQETIEKGKSYTLDRLNSAMDQISKVWSRIPFLGNLDFKQTFLATVILVLVWQFVYRTPVRRKIR